MEIIVTNQRPKSDTDVPTPLMELFQKYTLKKSGEAFPPFVHQAEAFRQIYADKEVFLVAGTAAGKTLAVAVPLFKETTKRLYSQGVADVPDNRTNGRSTPGYG